MENFWLMYCFCTAMPEEQMFGTSHSMGGPPATEQTLGLPVAVVLLRRDGQRIAGDEFRAAQPLVGCLLLGPTSRQQNGGGASHMADLLRPGTTACGSLCKPLFNPPIELADSRGFVLSGYEIQAVDGAVEKRKQAWLVQPLTAANPFSG
jgi:hypothetical protein